MAVLARRMRRSRKTAIVQLPMTIRASHSILGDMEVMAERELIVIFLVTARQCNSRQQANSHEDHPGIVSTEFTK
jgi:hypothetical protein